MEYLHTTNKKTKKLDFMKTTIAFILMLFTLNLHAQENKITHPLNEEMNNIIHAQIMNDLEYNIPVFISSQGLTIFTNININNNKIYFQEDRGNPEHIKKRNELIAEDLGQYIHFHLIKEGEKERPIAIRAYSKEQMLLNISYKSLKEVNTVYLELPDGQFSKELKYNANKLVSCITKKGEWHYFQEFKYLGDSIIQKLSFDTNSEKYQHLTQHYTNGNLQKSILFKNTKTRKPGKIKHSEFYEYLSDGKIYKRYTKKINGKIIDSTRYFYNNGLLSSTTYYKGQTRRSIFFEYDQQKRVVRKEIHKEDTKVKITYEYNLNNQLAGYCFSDNSLLPSLKYTFEYTKSGKLSGFKLFKNNTHTNTFDPINQYSFSYSNTGMIETIRGMNNKGLIQKEISYEIQDKH